MSAPSALRARGIAASLLERLPSGSARPLAEPPAGSGLAPVMGEPGLPVVGHSIEVFHDLLGLSRRFHRRFGPVFWTSVAGTKLVIVLGPDGIETVLTNRDRAFSSREGWSYFIGPFFERGVMLMDFEEHRHHRRIMQQAFKRERLARLPRGDEPGNRTRPGSAGSPGAASSSTPRTKQLTLDIATEVFVGAELGEEADRLNGAFVDAVHGGQAIVRADVPGGKWHRGLEGRRLLEEYFRAQLPAKRAGDGDDLFSVLCHAESEDGDRFSDEDVVNHMIFVLMAAHDTSTITLAMMVYYLAKHPDWQERLREESRALGASRDRLRRSRRARLDGPGLQRDAADERARSESSLARRSRTPRSTATTSPPGPDSWLGIYPTQRMGRGGVIPTRSTPSDSAPNAARTARTDTRGRRSAEASTSASACTLAVWRSKRSSTSCSCGTRGRCQPPTNRPSTTAPARSPATAFRSTCARCKRQGRRAVAAAWLRTLATC